MHRLGKGQRTNPTESSIMVITGTVIQTNGSRMVRISTRKEDFTDIGSMCSFQMKHSGILELNILWSLQAKTDMAGN